MTDNLYQQLRDKSASIRSGNRSDMDDVYAAARDLEIRNLAERMGRIIGRGNSEEFVLDVLAQVAREATKEGRR
jgi:hypothetical protein